MNAATATGQAGDGDTQSAQCRDVAMDGAVADAEVVGEVGDRRDVVRC